MLVIKRYVNEYLDIVCPNGDVIKVMLTETCGFGVAKIGVEASGDYMIYRGEIPVASRRPIECNTSAWRR